MQNIMPYTWNNGMLILTSKFPISKHFIQCQKQFSKLPSIPLFQSPLLLPHETSSCFTGAIIPLFQHSNCGAKQN